MLGSYAGCPSTTSTLKNGILKMMKYYKEEINDVILYLKIVIIE